MTRLIAAVPASPLWSNLESALRRGFGALAAPSAQPSAFEVLEGEQARIRQSSRLWLVG